MSPERICYFTVAMTHSPSIVRPTPFRNFSAEKIVYIPVDVPSGLIKKYLYHNSARSKTTEWGLLFRIGEGVVLFQAMGAPLCALSLERLIAGGAREILCLGFCGSLVPRLSVADVISVDRAFPDEGTSRHYAARRKFFRASPALRDRIEARLAAAGLPFTRATGVSTDAPFRETEGWLRSMQVRGCEAVDMETTAVFALAAFHGIEAASVMIVSDELHAGVWRNGFRDPLMTERARRYFLPLLQP